MKSKFSITSPFPTLYDSFNTLNCIPFLSFLEYFKAEFLFRNKFLMNMLEVVTSSSLDNKRTKREQIICYGGEEKSKNLPRPLKSQRMYLGITRVEE